MARSSTPPPDGDPSGRQGWRAGRRRGRPVTHPTRPYPAPTREDRARPTRATPDDRPTRATPDDRPTPATPDDRPTRATVGRAGPEEAATRDAWSPGRGRSRIERSDDPTRVHLRGRPGSRSDTGPRTRSDGTTRTPRDGRTRVDDDPLPPLDAETVELGSRERGSRRPRDPDDDPGPSKMTVTRVAAWRTRRLTKRGVHLFHRAASADGADRSGLTALTYAWMANYASDATLAVALANTLFFSAASAESKDKVALYLLVTVAPFALIAPVVGPLLDRLQRGRRLALAGSTAGQAVLAVVLALGMNTWVLYPAALGIMVLSKSFGVLKAAVTPRVLPPGITLVKTNSRLTVFGLVASGVAGVIAAGVSFLVGSAGAAWLTAAICGAAVWLCLRIPSWVEVTEGEVATTVLPRLDTGVGAEAAAGGRVRVPMSRHVVTALWANGTIRSLTGFLMLFAAFVVKHATEGSPGEQLVLLGLIGAAAGAGGFLGNALGARQDFGHPNTLITACLGGALAAAVLAALVVGPVTAAVVALVAATASALLKVCLDAVVQRDMPEESRASAFGRSETILQLSWVFGGALGVLLPPTWWLGFTAVAVVVALGTVQTVMISRGRSLVPMRRAAA